MRVAFHLRWYPVTLLFLAFDMEMVVMYGWVRVVAQVGSPAVIEMFVFLASCSPASATPTGKGRCGGPEDAAAPHVFILAWAGAEDVRLEAERLLRTRGWSASLSPADTDVLLVLAPRGTLTGEAATISQRFFAQLPQPAMRVDA